MRRRFPLALMLLVLGFGAQAAAEDSVHPFTAAAAGEAVAIAEISCASCDWGVAGREAASLEVRLDDEYSQHVLLTRGGKAEYTFMLGPVTPGAHTLVIRRNASLSAPDAADFEIASLRVEVAEAGTARYDLLRRAPFIYARPDTIGRFSDVPLLMWVESERTAQTAALRYSVIFSHEDGGTPTDRLMATWGRATDIEFVYGVEAGTDGRVLKEEYQGPEHEILPFKGQKLGAHPLLWVVTENNMVSDRGESRVRYAPAPIPFDLAGVSRESVMDAHPWTYEVMARELRREGRIDNSAAPGSRRIPDPRRFAYVEACGSVADATLAFDVAVRTGNEVEWHATDRGLPEFRIARSGCVRAAAPLPAGISADRIAGLRVRVYTRPPRQKEAPLPPDAGRAQLERVNTIFMLDDQYRPGPPMFRWTGPLELRAGTIVILPRECPPFRAPARWSRSRAARRPAAPHRRTTPAPAPAPPAGSGARLP